MDATAIGARSWALGVALLAVVAGLATCDDAPPAAERAATAACEYRVPEAVSQRLTRLLGRATRDHDCRLIRVATEYVGVDVVLASSSGVEHGLELLPAACGSPGARPAGAFALHPDDASAGLCADAVDAIVEALDNAPHVAPRAIAPLGPDRPSAKAADERPELVPPGLARVYVQWGLPLLWLVLLLSGAALLAGQAQRAHKTGRWATQLLLPLAIFAGAVALRAALGPWTPANPTQNPVTAALSPDTLTDFGHYGRAFEALLASAMHVLPLGDDLAIGLNILFGAGACLALASLLRRMGARTAIALAAAILLAALPLQIRFSATVCRYIPAIFLALAGWALLLAWLDERRPLQLVAAVAALTLAPQCRSDLGWLPLATLALVLLTERSRRFPAGSRPGFLLPRPLWIAGAVYAVLMLLPALGILEELLDPLAEDPGTVMTSASRFFLAIVSPEWNTFVDPTFTSPLYPALAVIGVLFSPRHLRRYAVWLAVVGGLSAILAAPAPHDDAFPNFRYQLFSDALFCGLGALGLAAVARIVKTPRAAAVVLSTGTALAVLTSLPPAPNALRQTLLAQEYHFLRRSLPALAEGCEVVTINYELDPAFAPDAATSYSAGRAVVWNRTMDWEPQPGSCAVHYRGVKCHILTKTDERHTLHPEVAAQPREFCEETRKRAVEPVVVGKLRTTGQFNMLPVDTVVPVGFYWLSPAESEARSP